MISGHVFIATSLDGYIARDDGTVDWLLRAADPADDHGYDRFLADIDVIVMGRGSFAAVQAMSPWPYALPVLVLSATLAGQPVPPALAGKVRFSDVPPAAAMAMLEAEGARRVYVDGGLVVQSFLRAGLIADMVITQIPLLLGQGRPLFGALGTEIVLAHEGTRTFSSGLVQSRYRVAA